MRCLLQFGDSVDNFTAVGVEHDGEHDDESRYDLPCEVAESHEQESVV